GVTFEDPATAYVGPEVTIGRDTVIGPNVVLRGRTRLGAGCRLDGTAYLVDATVGDRVHVRFGTVMEGAEVGADAVIGPFARLGPWWGAASRSARSRAGWRAAARRRPRRRPRSPVLP